MLLWGVDRPNIGRHKPYMGTICEEVVHGSWQNHVGSETLCGGSSQVKWCLRSRWLNTFLGGRLNTMDILFLGQTHSSSRSKECVHGGGHNSAWQPCSGEEGFLQVISEWVLSFLMHMTGKEKENNDFQQCSRKCWKTLGSVWVGKDEEVTWVSCRGRKGEWDLGRSFKKATIRQKKKGIK